MHCTLIRGLPGLLKTKAAALNEKHLVGFCRSGSALRMHRASFEFTSVKDPATCSPSGRARGTSTLVASTTRTKSAIVESLAIAPTGARGRVKGSS